MAAQSLLAKLGVRLATLGSAASLAIASPLSEGAMGMDAHTSASRIGVYFDRTTSAEKMGLVVMGSEILSVGVTGVTCSLPMTSTNIRRGTATPEGAVTGSVGDIFQRTDGGAGTTLYVKQSGNVTTAGWSALGGASATVYSNPLLGTDNESFGSGAGAALAAGALRNSLFGRTAGTAINTGDDNACFGWAAGVSLTTGGWNTFVGSEAGRYQLTVANQVAIGYQALRGNATPANNTGTFNTAIGYQALLVNTSGSRGTALGYQALLANTTGADNTALGHFAGASLTTGGLNTFVGSEAGRYQLTVSSQVAIGYQALQGDSSTPANNTGTNNIAIGSLALARNRTGSRNTAIGANTGGANWASNNSDNVLIGHSAGGGIISELCSGNTFVGSSAGGLIDRTASYNVAIGFEALQSTGQYPGYSVDANVAIGYQALKAIGTGDDFSRVGHIFIGYQAGVADSPGVGCIAIGYQATVGWSDYAMAFGANASASSNQLVFGSSTHSVTNMFVGKGATAAAPVTVTFQATGGSGTNIAGARLNIAGGRGTGTGAGGSVVIQASAAGASGAALNAVADICSFSVATGIDCLNSMLANFRASVGTDATATITLATSQQATVLRTTSGSAVAVTLPNSMPVGYTITIIQRGAGQITFAAGAGATLTNRQTHTKTAGQYAVVSLVVEANAGSAAAWVLAGDTVA